MIPRPPTIKSSHTLDSISGSEWYTYPLPIDDAVAALEGALLCVSIELLQETPSTAKGEVVCTPATLLHILQNSPEALVADAITLEEGGRASS